MNKIHINYKLMALKLEEREKEKGNVFTNVLFTEWE